MRQAMKKRPSPMEGSENKKQPKADEQGEVVVEEEGVEEEEEEEEEVEVEVNEYDDE
jgi:hypothetical protein